MKFLHVIVRLSTHDSQVTLQIQLAMILLCCHVMLCRQDSMFGNTDGRLRLEGCPNPETRYDGLQFEMYGVNSLARRHPAIKYAT